MIMLTYRILGYIGHVRKHRKWHKKTKLNQKIFGEKKVDMTGKTRQKNGNGIEVQTWKNSNEKIKTLILAKKILN